MDSEFNSYSFEEIQDNEIVLGESERFVFSKKRIYGRMHFLKRPSSRYKNDLITLESLRKEFAIGYSLDHPNITRYFRLENNTLFEEYIDGKSMRELIEEDDPRLRNKSFLQNLCFQFLDILRYLREMGVVHNDIKPENIIITRRGNSIKLVDFNCAQSSDNDILAGYSLPYKSPEQGIGEIDCTSDLYQFGKVVEELSTLNGYKNWKKFIAGTTAKNPAHRISLDTAEKLIPGQNKSKKLLLVIFPVLILAVLFVFLFPLKHTETITIQPSNPIRDTVIIQDVKPSLENITEKPETRQVVVVDIKKVIEKKILDYTDNYYKTNLYPICRESLENSDRKLTVEEDLELRNAIDKAYSSAINYAEKLSSEYPEEKNYIEKECLHSFEMKISALMLKLYPTTGS